MYRSSEDEITLPGVPAIASATTGATPKPGPRAGGSARCNWLQRAFVSTLTTRGDDASAWAALAQRMFGLRELNDLLAEVEARGRPDGLAALAEALDIRYQLDGLENLKSIGNRPVVLFANHPTGGGNVLGLTTLLANQFPDYRILGNQHMKLMRSLSEKMIPVDPFSSSAALNLESLMKLREEFGTKYQALGVFPAGISSRLHLSGLISDRQWRDAFIRIARHHDALLVPVWFSGRNRLRYYLASRVCNELGFLALPAEFLRLRGKTINVRIGEPIEPEVLSAIPNRRAQMSFLRAAVYELDRDEGGVSGKLPRLPTETFSRRIELPYTGAVALGKHFEMRIMDSASAMRIKEIAAASASDLAAATYHVVVSAKDRVAPYAHWQVLDWRQFSDNELDELSPVRKAFRLPVNADWTEQKWLEVVSFSAAGRLRGSGGMRCVLAALRRSVALASATDVVGLVASREKYVARVALQFARLQKTFTDAALLCAEATHALMGATRHHDWQPLRDVAALNRLPGRQWLRNRMQPTAAMLGRLATIGFRFGAAGLMPDTARPCVLARLSLPDLAVASNATGLQPDSDLLAMAN